MQQPHWSGVFPAVTTKFTADNELDNELFAKATQAQLDAGVHGIVVLGTLGEAPVLSDSEKREIVSQTVATVAGKVPVLACVAETTTREAARFAEQAASLGADGLMVLPGMLYSSDRRETMAHFRAVAAATDLPIMIYNNPVSYRVDITPEMFAELADEPHFVAIKESSDDVRRITDITNRVGNRYQIFTGVDDLALESLMLGAVGWVAGLVNPFPRETVAIYELAKAGRYEEAREIYRWFMPMLHLDVSTKLVQNIKLVEALTGQGNEYVRAPRLPLQGEERAQVEAIVSAALAARDQQMAV